MSVKVGVQSERIMYTGCPSVVRNKRGGGGQNSGNTRFDNWGGGAN